MGKYVSYYLKNGSYELMKLTDSILKKDFAWLPMSYYDDVYSLASMLLWECEQKYDNKKNTQFNEWFKFCLKRKIKTYITFINRDKRTQKDNQGKPIADVSIDAPIQENGDCLGDIIADSVNEGFRDNTSVDKYISTLPNEAKRVLKMLVDGYNIAEISNALGCSRGHINDIIKLMKSERRIKILRR